MYYHWFVHLLCWFSGNAQGSAYFVFLRIRTPTGTVCGPSRPEACADSTRPGRVLQEKWNHFLMTWFITSDAFGLSIFCSTVYSSPIFKSLTSFWSGVLFPINDCACLMQNDMLFNVFIVKRIWYTAFLYIVQVQLLHMQL